MAREVPVTQARAEFADLVNRVVYGGERIVVTRHGKPIAALVPAADLDRLEQVQPADEPAAPTVIRLAGGRGEPAGGPGERAGGTGSAPTRRFDIAARDGHDGPTG